MIAPDDALDLADAVGCMAAGVPLEMVCVIPRVAQNWCDPVLVGIGGAGAVSARPREVLRAVLTAGGHAFVLAHTHLSTDAPSPEDQAVTRRLVAAAAVVGVPMLAHLVVGPQHVWDCMSGHHQRLGQKMVQSGPGPGMSATAAVADCSAGRV